MPDLTIDLPDKLHERFVQVAKAEGTDAETLARQIITLKVGYNPSSREKPISTGFLERQTDDVLLVAEKEPVYFVDPGKREFVLVSNIQYEQLLTSETPQV